MQIELSIAEAKTIQAALGAYKKAPQTEGLLTQMMMAILLGKPNKGESDAAQRKTDCESQQREEEIMPINHRIEAMLIESASDSLKNCIPI